jgi:hypothetical protein
MKQFLSAPLLLVACLLSCSSASADPPVHYLHGGILVPGAIGTAQLQRGGPLPGYFQPMEVSAPAGTAIAVADQNQFTVPQPAPLKAGMMIGPVYRLRVTNIPQHTGEEVYPTIEVINRLYPPCGEELKFPVPIELAQEDLVAAIDGRFVTRIVYVENPRAAYPRVEDPHFQLTVECSPKDDPLVMADRLGRPIAIVRIGGRIPTNTANPDSDFMYNSPPLLLFNQRAGAPPVEPLNVMNRLPAREMTANSQSNSAAMAR